MQPQSPQHPGNSSDMPLPAAALPEVPAPATPGAGALPAAAPQFAGAPIAESANDGPAMADDGDLIEKEWVHKVKQLVSKTTQDPYELNRQFTLLKADYMQKRYGKSIKLSE